MLSVVILVVIVLSVVMLGVIVLSVLNLNTKMANDVIQRVAAPQFSSEHLLDWASNASATCWKI